uniref:Uncharacterized protein n=1 Tax=viral metagenome TaxID=1070528 RepID=A0A6C0KAI1_9ZZZZ
MTKMKVTVTQTINKAPFNSRKAGIFDLDDLKTGIKLNKTRGFVGVNYRKKLKTDSRFVETSNYNRPALDSLPGTWCASCPAREGTAHDSDCAAPEESELLMTTKGMLKLIGDSKTLGSNSDLQKIRQEYKAGTVTRASLQDVWLGSIVKDSNGYKQVPGKVVTNFRHSGWKVRPGPGAQVKDPVTGEVYARPKDSKTSEELSFNNALTLRYIGQSKTSGSKNIGVRLFASGSVEVFSAPPDMLDKLYSDLKRTLGKSFEMVPSSSPITSMKIEHRMLDNVTLDVNDPEVRKQIESSIPEVEFEYKQRVGTLQFRIEQEKIKYAVQIHRGGTLQLDVSRIKNTESQTKENHYYSLDLESIKEYVVRMAEKVRKSVSGVIAPAVEKNSKGLLTTVSGTWPNGPCRATRQVKGKTGMKEMQRPTPYSFRGKCPEPNQYLIPQGKNGRGGKVYYPCCGILTGTAETKYRNQLLKGFPGVGDDAIGNPDTQSGVIPPEYFVVGAKVRVKRQGGSRSRSGSRSQYVQATMVEIHPSGKTFVVERKGKLRTITRKDLQPESRKFKGFFERFKNAPSGIEDDTSDLLEILKRLRPTEGILNSKFPKPSVRLSYLTIDDVPSLARAKGVAVTEDPGAVPVQFSVEQSALFVIHHGVSVYTASLTAGSRSSQRSGVGFFNATTKSLELVDADYTSSDTRIKSIRLVSGNVMNLMTKKKGVSQWLIGLPNGFVAYQEKPSLSLSLTVIRKHKIEGEKRDTHKIVGYKDVKWKEDEPVRYLKKCEIGKTYMMEFQFNNRTGLLSEGKPLRVIKEIEPVFSAKVVENAMTYAIEYPIFKRKTVAGQLLWIVNDKHIDSSFKIKQFKKKK